MSETTSQVKEALNKEATSKENAPEKLKVTTEVATLEAFTQEEAADERERWISCRLPGKEPRRQRRRQQRFKQK